MNIKEIIAKITNSKDPVRDRKVKTAVKDLKAMRSDDFFILVEAVAVIGAETQKMFAKK